VTKGEGLSPLKAGSLQGLPLCPGKEVSRDLRWGCDPLVPCIEADSQCLALRGRASVPSTEGGPHCLVMKGPLTALYHRGAFRTAATGAEPW